MWTGRLANMAEMAASAIAFAARMRCCVASRSRVAAARLWRAAARAASTSASVAGSLRAAPLRASMEAARRSQYRADAWISSSSN